MSFPRAAALLCTFLPIAGTAAQTVKTTSPAVFGVEIRIQAQNGGYPAYLPATRYVRQANAFEIDFEFLANAFGPFPPGTGDAVVSLGELPPGTYSVRARMHDIAGTTSIPDVASATFDVAPPAPGIYTVPRTPGALAQSSIVLSSALHVDPATMRVSMAPDLVRVDFEFLPDAPASGTAPAGYAAYATAELPPLNAGRYRIEAWGRPKNEQGARLHFTRELTVQRLSRVVEFYNETLDHYFMTARAEEISALDSGAYGVWKRTGQSFHAWTRLADASPDALPVCRFYAPIHNSHFFTADPIECDALKAQEKQGRESALASKQAFVGWQFEQIAFHELPASGPSCPAGTSPVGRTYNNRAAQNDANYRFTADGLQSAAMLAGWVSEGVAFCAPW